MSVRLALTVIVSFFVAFALACERQSVSSPKNAQAASDLPKNETGKVLVVHSYHREYEWVAGISRGVKRALETTNIDLETFYMDTKRRTDVAWKQESGQLALKSIQAWKPDVVIAVDDNAQQYCAKHLIGRSKPYIVFCGVNAEAADYGYPAENATGILERPHFAETISLLKRVMPNIGRVAIITDNSPTSAGALKFMRGENVGVDIVSWQTPDTFTQWQQEVLAAQGEADAIITYMYHTVTQEGSEQSMPPGEVMAWSVDHSRIPFVGLFSFAIDDGMLCGVVESAVEHGVEAGGIARRILAGTPVSEIPVVTATQGQTMLNLETARRLGIVVAPDLVADVDVVIGDIDAP